jgi:hypothetical protein
MHVLNLSQNPPDRGPPETPESRFQMQQGKKEWINLNMQKIQVLP